MNDFSFNTNFLGRDGFTWWVGQVAPYNVNKDQDTPEGWGTRYKVRIMGYHPYSTAELPDEDLPWAQVMRPPGTGTGSAGMVKTIHFNQGDNVIGFFLDGENAQQPIIMGAIGNSKYAAKDDAQEPFGKGSGHNSDVQEPSETVRKQTESSDVNQTESPQSRSPAQTKDSANKATMTSTDEYEVAIPCGGNDSPEQATGSSFVNDMKVSVGSFSDFIRRVDANFDEGSEFARDLIQRELGIKTKSITGAASGLVTSMVMDLGEQLIPILTQGLEMLYESVFATTMAATGGNYAAARLAGLEAQEAMAPPIQTLQEAFPCVINKIANNLEGVVSKLLNSVADNVVNFVQCVGDQTIGVLANDIIAQIADGLSDALGGINKILQFISGAAGNPAKFVENLMRNTVGGLLGLVGVAGCNDSFPKGEYGPCKTILGLGPAYNQPTDFKGIIDNANVNAVTNVTNVAGLDSEGITDIVGGFDVFNSASKEPGFKSDTGGCYTGTPLVCGPPQVYIFGGGGDGAAAAPIYGFPDTGKETASIIDIEVTNPGNGYSYPPFVQILDNCNQGYGAVARATVKDGKVDKIYISSIGENYPAPEVDPVVVDRVDIINPGSGYDNGVVEDNLGNQYQVDTFNGAIIKVTPINTVDIVELPRIFLTKGSGAILIPKLGKRPPQEEVKQVIDCVV